jgi:restriction system protein
MHSISHAFKGSDDSAVVSAMSGRELERLIGEAFRQRGFTVTGFGREFARGADLALSRNGQRFLVQLKHWRNPEVGALAIRELGAALRPAGAQGAFMITAGRFTREARELALEARIQLIDGAALPALIDASGSLPPP